MDYPAIEKARPVRVATLQPAEAFPGILEVLAPSERVVAGFFLYFTILASIRGLPANKQLLLLSAAPVLYSLCLLERTFTRPWTRILREFLSLVLILSAYWSIELFAPSQMRLDLQDRWSAWDRTLLSDFGLRRAIESLGTLIPWALETAYLMLYALPPIFLTILYVTGSRKAAKHYLFVLLLGVLTVYGLLPFVTVDSPRVVYPGKDLPSVVTPPRAFNTWVLDRMDISTSVFPSGHVAVAFSTAFALISAVPRRRRLQAAALVAAVLVYLATIYGRYHYSVDGAASIAITALVCAAGSRWAAGYFNGRETAKMLPFSAKARTF